MCRGHTTIYGSRVHTQSAAAMSATLFSTTLPAHRRRETCNSKCFTSFGQKLIGKALRVVNLSASHLCTPGTKTEHGSLSREHFYLGSLSISFSAHHRQKTGKISLKIRHLPSKTHSGQSPLSLTSRSPPHRCGQSTRQCPGQFSVYAREESCTGETRQRRSRQP